MFGVVKNAKTGKFFRGKISFQKWMPWKNDMAIVIQSVAPDMVEVASWKYDKEDWIREFNSVEEMIEFCNKIDCMV